MRRWLVALLQWFGWRSAPSPAAELEQRLRDTVPARPPRRKQKGKGN